MNKEQPIQKEEEVSRISTPFFSLDATPSDTFIEGIIDRVLRSYIHFEYIDFQGRSNAHKGTIEWTKYVIKELLKLDDTLEKDLKSSLQQQREAILEEIEKALNSTDNILGGDTNKLIHLQCHLKSLLKNN